MPPNNTKSKIIPSGTKHSKLSKKISEPRPRMLGKKVAAILNLPPRKMMGLDSNGMLLSAVRTVDGKEDLHLMIVGDDVPVGSRLC